MKALAAALALLLFTTVAHADDDLDRAWTICRRHVTSLTPTLSGTHYEYLPQWAERCGKVEAMHSAAEAQTSERAEIAWRSQEAADLAVVKRVAGGK